MVEKIQKWGDTQGIPLTKQILGAVKIAVGDEVNVTLRHGSIVIVPKKPLHVKRSLQELVSCIPKDYQFCEFDWGVPMGKEVW